MKRFAIILALTAVCGAGVAQAQTTAAVDEQGYVEATGGPTFGHKANGSFGAEGGYWFTSTIGVFAEAGRMQNVATKDFENDGQLIGALIGATVDARTRATYFDVGVTYRFPMSGRRLQPYVLVGVGAAKVTNDSRFSVGGTDVTDQLLDRFGVQLGTDLSGGYTKVFVTAGGGVHVPFGSRLLGDISYRFGSIGKNNENGAEIKAISTNRLQFGIGARF
jgi:opacity protein-like surface antigen